MPRTGSKVSITGIGSAAVAENWQTIFDSNSDWVNCGEPLKAVWFLPIGGADVNIRITGMHEIPGGLTYETASPANGVQVRTAWRGDRGLIEKIEVNAAAGGSQISWGPA